MFPPTAMVAFFTPIFWSPTIAIIVAFSGTLPRFCTTTVMVTSEPTVTDVALEVTEYTDRLWGDAVWITTTRIEVISSEGVLCFPDPVTVRVYVPGGVVEPAVMVMNIVCEVTVKDLS